MEPERWQEIERLCYSALNEEKSARAAFLERACGGDEALRRVVELLLAQHEKDDDFLEVPAMEVVWCMQANRPHRTHAEFRELGVGCGQYVHYQTVMYVGGNSLGARSQAVPAVIEIVEGCWR